MRPHWQIQRTAVGTPRHQCTRLTMRRVSSEAPCSIDRRTKLQAKCVALLLTSAACTKKTAGEHYELQGRVVAVDSGSRQLTVAHEDIPWLMQGMTVPFVVTRGEDWTFGKIGPGDHIHATLVISDHAELRDISFTNGSDTTSDGTSNLRLPEPGDDVPDFVFVNQFGKPFTWIQFRGRAAAADFCLQPLSHARLLPPDE